MMPHWMSRQPWIRRQISSDRLAMPRLRCGKLVLLFWFEALLFSYQGPYPTQGCRVNGSAASGVAYQSCASVTSILRRSVSVAPQWQTENFVDVSEDDPFDQQQKERRKEEKRREKEKRKQRKMERQRRKQEKKSRPPNPVPGAQPSPSPLLGPSPSAQAPGTLPWSPHGSPSSVPSMPPLRPPASPLNPELPPVQSPLAPLVAPPLAPSSPPPIGRCGICGVSYDGNVSDTLQAVSKICSINPDLLLKANPQIRTLTDGIAGKVTVPCTGDDPVGCNQCGASYYVQDGDNLGGIADDCGVPLNELVDANKDLLSFDYISPGQYLTVPCRQPVVSRLTEGCGDCGLFHTVRANETFSEVALTCNVTVDELQTANPALDGSLSEGQMLQIPCHGNSSEHCGLCGKVYKVLENDDGQAVQLKCRTKGLTAANPGVDLTNLDVGQLLHVPCTIPPSCSPCSPVVEINDTKLSNMASICGVQTELLMYANDISPASRNSKLKIGNKLSVPCDVLPAATNSCSICGATFPVLNMVSVARLAKACGVSASAIYAIPDNNLARESETVSYTNVLLPCESPAIGCGPCGVAYTAQNETLASVAVKCLVYPSTLKLLNPQFNVTEYPIATITMPCKNSLLELKTSSGLFIRPMQLSPSKLVRSVFSLLTSAGFVYMLL